MYCMVPSIKHSKVEPQDKLLVMMYRDPSFLHKDNKVIFKIFKFIKAFHNSHSWKGERRVGRRESQQQTNYSPKLKNNLKMEPFLSVLRIMNASTDKSKGI